MRFLLCPKWFEVMRNARPLGKKLELPFIFSIFRPIFTQRWFVGGYDIMNWRTKVLLMEINQRVQVKETQK